MKFPKWWRFAILWWMTLEIGPLTNFILFYFFALVHFIFVFNQTLVQHLYCEKGLLTLSSHWKINKARVMAERKSSIHIYINSVVISAKYVFMDCAFSGINPEDTGLSMNFKWSGQLGQPGWERNVLSPRDFLQLHTKKLSVHEWVAAWVLAHVIANFYRNPWGVHLSLTQLLRCFQHWQSNFY